MNEAETQSPLAAYASRLLCSMSGGAEVALLRDAVEKLFGALDAGGVCIALSDLGDPESVRARLAPLPVTGGPGEARPLILDGSRLYLQRYHAYECSVAEKFLILARASRTPPPGDDPVMRRLLSQALTVVTGGPGTGKTTLAARLLDFLTSGDECLSAALLAPTGKAAARLAEGVAPVLRGRGTLTLVHGTVHRILGSRGDSEFFRHDASRPLPFDVIVLDEASMADLPLTAKLLDAVDPARSRLIVLGDPGQLPSVRSGGVLADIVSAAQRGGPLARCFLRLERNHRSGDNPRLASLIDAVRDGNGWKTCELLAGGEPLAMEQAPRIPDIPGFAGRELMPFMSALIRCRSPEEALAALGSYRLVCMLRQGPCGADSVNALAVELARKLGYAEGGSRYFHGMPLIVTRNDHRQGLFNGDCGVILNDAGRLTAFFPSERGPRGIPLQNLPPCEPAYALTVHRSQGSEYRDMTLLLPPEDHPLLTRELFYTGVSRAREHLKVTGTPDLVRLALSRHESRGGGLAGRLG